MIILVGSPGSGKSTQGQLLTERGKLRWVSMSDILRSSNLDDEHKQKMKAGELFGGPIIFDSLSKALKELGDDPELILDGFPRSIDQAQWLINKQQQGQIKVSAVVNLNITREEVEKRLLKRGREDDEIAKIDKRISIFKKTYDPIFKILKNNNIKIVEINANQTPEEILKNIVEGLNKLGIEA